MIRSASSPAATCGIAWRSTTSSPSPRGSHHLGQPGPDLSPPPLPQDPPRLGPRRWPRSLDLGPTRSDHRERRQAAPPTGWASRAPELDRDRPRERPPWRRRGRPPRPHQGWVLIGAPELDLGPTAGATTVRRRRGRPPRPHRGWVLVGAPELDLGPTAGGHREAAPRPAPKTPPRLGPRRAPEHAPGTDRRSGPMSRHRGRPQDPTRPGSFVGAPELDLRPTGGATTVSRRRGRPSRRHQAGSSSAPRSMNLGPTGGGPPQAGWHSDRAGESSSATGNGIGDGLGVGARPAGGRRARSGRGSSAGPRERCTRAAEAPRLLGAAGSRVGGGWRR